jgi:hypothetical protein
VPPKDSVLQENGAQESALDAVILLTAILSLFLRMLQDRAT